MHPSPFDALLAEVSRLREDVDELRRITAGRRVYTGREVAALLRVSPTTIWRMVHRGALVPLPGSGKMLFARDRIDALVNGAQPTK
ncbi:MAG: helix-turn-helix domain-containing protein [Burkholderiales bacterium]|jgi:hypothetical protein|nr:helix-turn-helix domain-containing protein [Burkholderiales bacterium]